MLKDIEMMMMMLTIRMMKDHIDDDDDGHPYDASSHMLASKIKPCACTATTLPVRLPFEKRGRRISRPKFSLFNYWSLSLEATKSRGTMIPASLLVKGLFPQDAHIAKHCRSSSFSARSL